MSATAVLAIALSVVPQLGFAQIVNSDFETRSPGGPDNINDVNVTPGDCISGSATNRYAPTPWGRQSTPDYSTQFEVVFDNVFVERTTLDPAFDASPDGGCFMGFRSIGTNSNEGIYQEITIADASAPLKFTYEYTEYTQPSATRCEPLVEFRVNGDDDSNGTSISTAPNVGSATGPSVEGEWVSLETASFIPEDFGIADGGTMDIYLGVIANSCQDTWSFVDNTQVVLANTLPIQAVNDDFGAVSGLTGDTTDSVLDNDTLDDILLDPADVTLTSSGTADDGATALGLASSPAMGSVTMNAAGELIVAPGTTAGEYIYTYQICQNADLTNCNLAESTVTVEEPVIDAVDEPAIDISGFTGGTTDSVLDNDTLDGSVLDPNDVTLTSSGTASDGSTALGLDASPDSGSITMNGDGEIIVAAGTTAGSYTFTYEICDVVNVDNCDTAEAVIIVGPADIDAVDDPLGPVLGITGGTTDSVLDNDTLDGSLLDPNDITLASSGTATDGTTSLGLTTTPETGSITMNGDGEITVAVDTPAGSYDFTYEICENLNPDNCDIAVATVVVSAGTIDAVDDAPDGISGTDGGTTESVLDNDTFNIAAVDPADITLASSGTASDGTTVLGLDLTPTVGEITMNEDGEITVAAGTTGGTYAFTYEICENLNPDNCDVAVATVVVDPINPPVASNDTKEATDPGPVSIDPIANDTGVNLDPTSVVLTGTNAPEGSVLSENGKQLTVPGEGEWTVDPTTGVVTFTPAAGFSGAPTPAAYTISDELANISNEATLSVTVAPSVEIIANDDGPISLDGSNGSTSNDTIIANDTLDGDQISDDPSRVTLTVIEPPEPATGSISIDGSGYISASAGTAAGTYTVIYEICEVANPTNCATAEVEILIVDTGEGLINEIEDDLVSILEEDLAQTLTTQSSQISGYSADALDRLQSRSHDQCLQDVNALLERDNILFDTDKAIIKPAGERTIDEISTILATCAGSSFEIAGHTDHDASDAYNIDLSQRRVTAVLQALTARGLDTTGFVARGYGESQPIASNATEAGKAQNRRVEFRPLVEDDYAYNGNCTQEFSLLRTLDALANENGARVDGEFSRDQHNCITDTRSVFEGRLSYLDTGSGQTQSAINLSYRREQYNGDESVFGYFVGLYGSQSDVTRSADGEINGVGINGGVYGANRLQNELFVDYYLGAAAGRHTFDLAFARSFGTVDASGDYQYLAGFAGAALSGQVDVGEATVTPRVGFDYVYTPGADVDLVAELSGLTETGNLELDAISGGRFFAEVRTEHVVFGGDASFWVNPRVVCYQSLGSLNGVCGVGGSIGIESTLQEHGLTYAIELDGDWGEDFNRGSFGVSVERPTGIGVLSGKADLATTGAATLEGAFEVEF